MGHNRRARSSSRRSSSLDKPAGTLSSRSARAPSRRSAPPPAPPPPSIEERTVDLLQRQKASQQKTASAKSLLGRATGVIDTSFQPASRPSPSSGGGVTSVIDTSLQTSQESGFLDTIRREQQQLGGTGAPSAESLGFKDRVNQGLANLGRSLSTFSGVNDRPSFAVEGNDPFTSFASLSPSRKAAIAFILTGIGNSPFISGSKK